MAGFSGSVETIDGRPAGAGPNSFGVAGAGDGNFSMTDSVPMPSPGTHIISLTLKREVSEGVPRPGSPPPKVHFQDELVFSSIIDVPDGQVISTRPIEPSTVSPSVRQSLHPMNFQCVGSEGQRYITGSIHIDKPSVGIAFDVFVRYENREYRAGQFYAPAGIIGTVYFTDSPSWIPAPPGKLDVILRSNSQIALSAARNAARVAAGTRGVARGVAGGVAAPEIWQGELIYGDVPVLMGRSSAATQPAPRSVEAGPISTLPSTLNRDP
jgi:hypothetical protein